MVSMYKHILAMVSFFILRSSLLNRFEHEKPKLVKKKEKKLKFQIIIPDNTIVPPENDIDIVQENDINIVPQENDINIVPQENDINIVPQENDINIVPQENDINIVPQEND